MTSRLLLSFVFIVGFFPLVAQNEASKENKWSFGANGYYGAIFRYRQGTSVLNFTDPFAVELYANLQTVGKRQWERVYRHPKIGFAVTYYNYGVPDELGEAVSLTSYFDNSIIKREKSSLNFNLGTGFVYHTTFYKPITNELNKAIGSKISFALRGNVRYELALKDNIFLNFNIAFRHFSNGGLNKPNNGMNFPLLGVGIRFQPKEVQIEKGPSSEIKGYNRNIQLNLKLAAGRKEVLLIDKKHPVYSLVFYGSKRLSLVSGLLVGADAKWDSSLRNEFINDMASPPEGDLDPRMLGITVGHELFIGDVSFVFQLGRYIYQPYDLFPDFYQRYGLQYYMTKNISVSGMLVAHTRTADFAEFGIGFHL